MKKIMKKLLPGMMEAIRRILGVRTGWVTVKTVSYTGWKIVSVIPNSVFNMGMYETRLFFVMLLIISMLLIIFVNQMVSSSVASPLEKLNESVKEWEAGNMNPGYLYWRIYGGRASGTNIEIHSGADPETDG